MVSVRLAKMLVFLSAGKSERDGVSKKGWILRPLPLLIRPSSPFVTDLLRDHAVELPLITVQPPLQLRLIALYSRQLPLHLRRRPLRFKRAAVQFLNLLGVFDEHTIPERDFDGLRLKFFLVFGQVRGPARYYVVHGFVFEAGLGRGGGAGCRGTEILSSGTGGGGGFLGGLRLGLGGS